MLRAKRVELPSLPFHPQAHEPACKKLRQTAEPSLLVPGSYWVSLSEMISGIFLMMSTMGYPYPAGGL